MTTTSKRYALHYKKEFEMVDGSPTHLTVGNTYPLLQETYDEEEEEMVATIINDNGSPHFFGLSVVEGKFNTYNHFDVLNKHGEVLEAA